MAWLISGIGFLINNAAIGLFLMLPIGIPFWIISQCMKAMAGRAEASGHRHGFPIIPLDEQKPFKPGSGK